jgi:uncharacterized protein
MGRVARGRRADRAHHEAQEIQWQFLPGILGTISRYNPGDVVPSPNLTDDDRSFLASYREALHESFGDIVEDVIVFGSKARGEATDDSDLDVLVLVRHSDWRLKWRIADVAYGLAIGTDVVPSVKVYARHEWDRLGEMRSEFQSAISRDGVAAA